jgi:hypothetical protein
MSARLRGGKPTLEGVPGGLAVVRQRSVKPTHVRCWPKADMPKNAIDVAIGGKADMTCCDAYVCF